MTKRLLLLLASSLAVPLACAPLPVFAQAVTAAADQNVEAAKKVLEAAEAAETKAEETGGDIRAAKRSLALALQALRAAEAAAARPALSPTPSAPAAGAASLAPQPPQAPVPKTETAATGPAAPVGGAAPAPGKSLANSQPASRIVTRLPDGNTQTRISLSHGRAIIDIRDPSGRLIRRIAIASNGTETVVVDHAHPHLQKTTAPSFPAAPPYHSFLPPLFERRDLPSLTSPAAEIDGDRASAAVIAGVLSPIAAIPGRHYTVGEVSRSARLRDSLPGVTVAGLDFPKGSAHLSRDGIWRLGQTGVAMRGILERWPDQVFLIEVHADASGSRAAQRQLCARRAASIAGALVRNFGIPQQNLVAEGYRDDDITTTDATAGNRVTIRNITPLLIR